MDSKLSVFAISCPLAWSVPEAPSGGWRNLGECLLPAVLTAQSSSHLGVRAQQLLAWMVRPG